MVNQPYGQERNFRQTGSTTLAAGTSEPLTSQATHGDNYNALCAGVQLRMPSANAGTLWVGYRPDLQKDINAALDGMPLSPGDDFFVPCSSPDQIYIIGTTADKVNWMAV